MMPLNGENRFEARPLSRRSLLLTGVAAGALALAGCSWTPRNASSQQVSASTQVSEQASLSSNTVAESSARVDDSLILVSGGTFTMGSPADEPWRSDD